MTTNETPQWSGELLHSPEMVEAFATQLRGLLGEHADYVARIRRDAEAMWAANPPEGYSSFEGWYRERWVRSPLAKIQRHLEEAAAETFRLEARFRKGRHELPAVRQAKREAKAAAKSPQVTAPQAQAELGSGQFGRRSTGPSAAPAPASGEFIDLVKRNGARSA